MKSYTVTRDLGGKTAPTPMSVAPPNGMMQPSALLGMDVAGVNAPQLADLLSSFLAHERCGVHLYRAVAGATLQDDWRAQFERFGDQTKEHVRILEELVTSLGGDPMYVSPAARLTETQNTKIIETMLVSGSFDQVTAELSLIEAVIQAERKCHNNWSFLSQISDSLPASGAATAIKKAVDEVEQQEDEHVQWAEQAWENALRSSLLRVS
jgi:rubrerythrin